MTNTSVTGSLDPAARARRGLGRQLSHWSLASERLSHVGELAPEAAWSELERYTGVALRQSLSGAVARLRTEVRGAAKSVAHGTLNEAEAAIQRLRRAYLRTETTLDFFADAVSTRTDPRTAALLRAADALAVKSMRQVLDPMGQLAPPVLTYLDKGIGASILKAGLRLWDGGIDNPVAAIKVVRHNLLRPTSVLHEAGHQVAHIVGWNDELARAIADGLPEDLGPMFSEWASEIAADGYAFAHSGYASVAALHDVVDGGRRAVFAYHIGDPHPISFLRVLLGVEMCRLAYGPGAWDDLASLWRARYPLSAAPAALRDLLERSLRHLRTVASIVLDHPRRAFGGLRLTQLVDPARVAPAALDRLEAAAGPSLERSPHWLEQEGLRLIALTGYRFATTPRRASDHLERHVDWMLRLGELRLAA